MIKNTIIAVLSLLFSVGFALPAFASGVDGATSANFATRADIAPALSSVFSALNTLLSDIAARVQADAAEYADMQTTLNSAAASAPFVQSDIATGAYAQAQNTLSGIATSVGAVRARYRSIRDTQAAEAVALGSIGAQLTAILHDYLALPSN